MTIMKNVVGPPVLGKWDWFFWNTELHLYGEARVLPEDFEIGFGAKVALKEAKETQNQIPGFIKDGRLFLFCFDFQSAKFERRTEVGLINGLKKGLLMKKLTCINAESKEWFNSWKRDSSSHLLCLLMEKTFCNITLTQILIVSRESLIVKNFGSKLIWLTREWILQVCCFVIIMRLLSLSKNDCFVDFFGRPSLLLVLRLGAL